MKAKRRILSALMSLPLLSLFGSCAYTAPFHRLEPAAEDSTAVLALSVVESRPGQRSAFFADTKRVLADLPNRQGLLGYSFRFELIGSKAWTMTAWKDEASRDRFVTSPLHRAAVKNARVTAQNMRFLSLTVPLTSLPMKLSESMRLLETAPAY